MATRKRSDEGGGRKRGASGNVAFAGRPGRMRLIDASLPPIDARTRIELPPELEPRREGAGALRARRDPARARLRLARSTPPGHYLATLRSADGSAREIAIDVEPRQRLRVKPNALRFRGTPESAVSATLSIENRGNVAVEIAETQVSGVFDDNGIEDALASVYRLETDDVQKIVGQLFKRLREAHGGLMKLRVTEGAGTLGLGERRNVTFETVLAAKLRGGHRYHGVLTFAGHDIAIEVEVGDKGEVA